MKTNGDREMDEGAELPERVQLEMKIMRGGGTKLETEIDKAGSRNT